jgi:diphthamide synthase (EF-2-diphthine--ammonia ligase)
MESLIEHGFEVKFISVSSEGLDRSWLGKSLTMENLTLLKSLATKFRFNLDGEGGEFETITINGPHMKNRIYCEGEAKYKSGRGIWEIQKANIQLG